MDAETPAPAQNPTILPFNPRPGFRTPGMVSKRKMATDMLRAATLMQQTEQRRATLERFLLAVLHKTGAVALGQVDIDAVANYHLVREPNFTDPTKSVFSAAQNVAPALEVSADVPSGK